MDSNYAETIFFVKIEFVNSMRISSMNKTRKETGH